jgi:hypothetical protein
MFPRIRFHLEELIVIQLVKKLPTFYGTLKFIILLKRTGHWPYSVPDASSPHFPKIHSNVITECTPETPKLPCSKSDMKFPLPKSFQRIRPSPRPCVTFRNKLAFTERDFWPFTQSQTWRSTPCQLSESAYSIYSWPPSVSGGRFRLTQSDDAPCHGNSYPQIWLNYVDNIKVDLEELGCESVDWIQVFQDRI